MLKGIFDTLAGYKQAVDVANVSGAWNAKGIRNMPGQVKETGQYKGNLGYKTYDSNKYLEEARSNIFIEPGITPMIQAEIMAVFNNEKTVEQLSTVARNWYNKAFTNKLVGLKSKLPPSFQTWIDSYLKGNYNEHKSNFTTNDTYNNFSVIDFIDSGITQQPSNPTDCDRLRRKRPSIRSHQRHKKRLLRARSSYYLCGFLRSTSVKRTRHAV